MENNGGRSFVVKTKAPCRLPLLFSSSVSLAAVSHRRIFKNRNGTLRSRMPFGELLRLPDTRPFSRLILTASSGLSVEISADSLLSRSLWELQNTNVILIGVLRKRMDRNHSRSSGI